jgi:hypothetical protein
MTFEAKCGGRCGACDEKITPGDECAYSDEVVVHADCEPAIARAARAARPICDRCFMETAANGKCGCDE